MCTCAPTIGKDANGAGMGGGVHIVPPGHVFVYNGANTHIRSLEKGSTRFTPWNYLVSLKKWFMVRAVHFLLKHQLHNASRDRAKNPSESPDLAFYRDNGETYLPNYAIIQKIVEAWLRDNVILIFFNTVCFASSVVKILLLRVLGKISILCTCSLLLSQSNQLLAKQAFPTLTSAWEDIITILQPLQMVKTLIMLGKLDIHKWLITLKI